MRRGTGGNHFYPPTLDREGFAAAVLRQLDHLHRVATETGRHLDLGKITVDSERLRDGQIRINVEADLVWEQPQ